MKGKKQSYAEWRDPFTSFESSKKRNHWHGILTELALLQENYKCNFSSLLLRILSSHMKGITRKTEQLGPPAFREGRQPRSPPFPGVTPAGSVLTRSLSMVLTRRRQRALLPRPCGWPCAPLRARAARRHRGAGEPAAPPRHFHQHLCFDAVINVIITTIFFFFFKFSTLEGGGGGSEDLPFLGFIC